LLSRHTLWADSTLVLVHYSGEASVPIRRPSSASAATEVTRDRRCRVRRLHQAGVGRQRAVGDTAGALGLHRAQQRARADVAWRRSNVAQYLHDFEGTVAAANQAADHCTAIDAPSHAAVVRIFAAGRLSGVGQHEIAAALLGDIPHDLPPVIRRCSSSAGRPRLIAPTAPQPPALC
jgi:hypothetical protein